MKTTFILVFRWIGAVVLPLPGAWLVSVLNHFCFYMMGFGDSFIGNIVESFATGGSLPFIAFYIAPKKRAITATVISSLMLAFIMFCMGVYWRNVTIISFINQFAVIVGIVIGIVSAFQIENAESR